MRLYSQDFRQQRTDFVPCQHYISLPLDIAIPALSGRCCAHSRTTSDGKCLNGESNSNLRLERALSLPFRRLRHKAGELRIEQRRVVLETTVLPLNYSPIKLLASTSFSPASVVDAELRLAPLGSSTPPRGSLVVIELLY